MLMNGLIVRMIDIIQPLSESDRELLRKFRDKMNKLEHKICPISFWECIVAATVIKMS
jgi:hypothetical protein